MGMSDVGELTVARLADGKKVQAPSPGATPSEAYRFQQLWKTRTFASQSMMSYADSLAALVDAGNNSAQAADQLGETVSGIASLIPGGVGYLTPSVVELGTKLVETGIKVKAATSLAKAVEAADPAVQGLADLLLEDLADVEELYVSTHEAIEGERYELSSTDYFKSHRVLTNAQIQLATLRAQENSRRAAINETIELLREQESFQRQALAKTQAEIRDGEGQLNEDELDALRSRANDHAESMHQAAAMASEYEDRINDEVMAAIQIVNSANADFAPHWERRQAHKAERDYFHKLIKSTRESVNAWKSAHADIARAIEEGRQPNWRALLGEVKEIHELVDAIEQEMKAADSTPPE